MANEITWSVALGLSKNGESFGNVSGSGNADVAGGELGVLTQDMSTTPAQINIGGCDQIQVISIKNPKYLADGTTLNTASVTIGLNTPITQVVSVIPPGKEIILWGTSATLYGQSSAGTPVITVGVAEN